MIDLLLQLPGVDPNDPHVKDLLASMQNQSEVSYEFLIYLWLMKVNRRQKVILIYSIF